ncbi:LRIF1 factor, partial [Bucorvus abyssinicus]|nr:LRIF1 factor [Bucorvus abyssinicus]
SIAGCMYRVVQTTGPDGKNLLKLLPIPKPSGSFVPIVQPSAMSNNSKPNIPNRVHITFKTQLASPAAPSSVKIPVFQPPNPGKIILTRAVDKQESVRAGSEKVNLTPNPAANAPSSCVAVDQLSLQNITVAGSSSQSNATYMVVNPKTVPVAVKPPVLPSDHHLQIPADAEVKSVPASSLPPAVQQKILTASPTTVSGGADSTKPPTVIYVSPVNTVKTVLPKQLQTSSPKPATEVSKTVIVTTMQKGNGSSPETVAADGQQSQQTPIKWIMQEKPQLATPRLVPVKSSNNVASKILKTLTDTQNVEVNSANILPVSSSSAGGSQTKIASIKDNALVMFNGKVYLLTKKGFDVLSAQADKQASSSSDASLKKETPKLINSTAVKKITSKVVNLVLSKSKGIVLVQKDPKPCADSKAAAPPSLRIDLKPGPAAPSPNADQQNATVDQKKSLPIPGSVSSGVTPLTAVGTQENMCQTSREQIPSPKAASAVFPQSEQEPALSDNWQKTPCEKMESPAKVIQAEHQEKPHWKQYLELREKFGLHKEERVYLKRIPLSTPCEAAEERDCSSNSVRKGNDFSSSLDVKTMNQRREAIKEEKVREDREEDVTKKRKIKSSSLSDSGKRRKTSVKSSTSPSSENTTSGSSVLTRSVSPPPVSTQPSNSADFVVSPVREGSEQDSYTEYKDVTDVTDSSVPIVVSSEDDTSVLEDSFRDDALPLTPPDLDETIRDEKIKRLKQLLRQREAALEEVRRK